MKDQLNRIISLTQIPKRIVSLVPSQTELLHDLGLENEIVGITKFCVHPVHYKQKKAIVGGTKQVHFEKIKALKPDIILCNKEENTKDMIGKLQAIAPVHISDVYTITDSLQLILMYGKLFNKTKASVSMVASIKAKQKAFAKHIEGSQKLKVTYFIWKNPWMVAAKNTFINEMLTINNFENCYKNDNRYPEIELSQLKQLKPEMILLSSEPYPFKEKDVKILKPLFPNTIIKIVDGEAFSWYGSRLLKVFDYFRTLRDDL
ncbi:ABC transporter substrate-binding protein [uncultured Psychroserpens sp.]|uniref:ABC transporter substrate-binding protein n=1 Tax=uncultured Psychroserpens sp. TaxID=255436 RepID=UPI0026206CB9|nr:helical backbone metal receptor [uncultured Psychroserpens sp.]